MTYTVDKGWFKLQMGRKGLSLRSVAKKMGIEPSALSRSLNSERTIKPEEIGQLADILELPPLQILEHIITTTDAPTATQMQGFGEMPQAQLATQPTQKRHPLFGSMKGTSIVIPGVDLTQPADPDWAKVYDDDYDHGVVTQQDAGGQ